MPFVKPLTAIGDAAPELLPDAPPLLDVQLAEKLVIALPLPLPAVNATETDASPLVALVIVGLSGAAAGTTAADAGDGELVPSALVAVTVHV